MVEARGPPALLDPDSWISTDLFSSAGETPGRQVTAEQLCPNVKQREVFQESQMPLPNYLTQKLQKVTHRMGIGGAGPGVRANSLTERRVGEEEQCHGATWCNLTSI